MYHRTTNRPVVNHNYGPTPLVDNPDTSSTSATQLPSTPDKPKDEKLPVYQGSSTMQLKLMNAVQSSSSMEIQPQPENPAPKSVLASSEQISQFMQVPGLPPTSNLTENMGTVDVLLKQVPGKVVFFNWDLNEQITCPEVPGKRVISPELEQELIARYCLVVDKNATPENAQVKAKAGRYWRSNAERDTFQIRGSGRACFLETGENLKGMGLTRLKPPSSVAEHLRHGKLGLDEALMETVYGELCAHLMDNKSTRVLAIIAPDDPTADYIIVRVGNLARPAHFGAPFTKEYKKLLEGGVSIEQILQAQAETVAAMYRYRVLHGAVNPANMGLFGTQIDLGTMTTQPRTEPMTNLSWMADPEVTKNLPGKRLNKRVFGAEHKAHIKFLRQIFPEKMTKSWTSLHRQAKNVETLMDCGLKKAVAEQLLQEEPDKAKNLAKHIRRLGRWHHRNVGNTLPNAGGEWDRSALADTHKMTAALPALFFDPATGTPKTPSEQDILDTLDLDVGPRDEKLQPDEKWRKRIPMTKKYGISNPDKGMAVINKSVAVIHALYPEMMARAAKLGIESDAYEDQQAFVACLHGRPGFENPPTESMYSPAITARLQELMKSYGEDIDERDMLERLSGDLPALIDNIVSTSKRRIDDLLFNTQVRPGDDEDSRRLQMQNIDGVLHYIEAGNDGRRELCLEIPLASLSASQMVAVLGADQQGKLSAQWTGATPQTSTATLSLPTTDSDETAFLKVRIPAAPYQYGQFAGKLQIGDEVLEFGEGDRKYNYAVPDRAEFREIVKKHVEAAVNV